MVGGKAFGPKNYAVYHSKSEPKAGCLGGSDLLIRNDISNIALVLDTPLQAVVGQIKLSQVYTICSLCLSPNTELSNSQLSNSQLSQISFHSHF